MTLFTMVDVPSIYNVILGQPILATFIVVASLYHQKLKFSMGPQVGVVRGSQQAALSENGKVRSKQGKKTRKY